MKTKFLIISLPSTGKTTLCNTKADELFNISRKPSGLVFLDFDIRFMRYVQDNLDRIRIDQTKLLISLLNSNDVIGVTGFATQFDFEYLFNCASILFKNIQLRVIFIVPTKRRLGQAVYDCFMRSSSKYTSLFMGDDDFSLRIYPWMSIISEVSRRYRKRLFAFDYWYNADNWLNDYIKRIKTVAKLYNDNTDCKNLVKCYFFSLDVGRFVQDVYRLFVTNANYKNVHGVSLISINDIADYDFMESASDKGILTDKTFERLLDLQSNECIKQGLRLWFERFRYIIPYDATGLCIFPKPLPSMPGDNHRRERLAEHLRKMELELQQQRYACDDERFNDATDMIEPLKDR